MDCILKELPAELIVEAARRAAEINPANAPHMTAIPSGAAGMAVAAVRKEFLALLTSRYWGAAGVDLTVAFMETIDSGLRNRILSHMNAWSQWANVHFQWVTNPGSAQVRITRSGGGYWSYLGTDILSIPSGQATMSLQGFTMNTPESEYRRVVRHETGHTLGFPHEHLRAEIIARLDPAKVIAWGRRVLGWDAQVVTEQILTPLDPRDIVATRSADATSIMCYQLPAEVTRDGREIAGGTDIDADDQVFVGKMYPLIGGPIHPPVAGNYLHLDATLSPGTYPLTPPGAPALQGEAASQAERLASLRPANMSADDWFSIIEEVISFLLRIWGKK